MRAEALLQEQFPDLRLGERITLAKIATPPVLPLLLADAEAGWSRRASSNPRLREDDLVTAFRQETRAPALLETVTASSRWSRATRCGWRSSSSRARPWPWPSRQMSGLVPRDLRRLAEAPVAPLLQLAACRLRHADRDRGNPS